MNRLLAPGLLVALAVAGCKPQTPPPIPQPHYTIGPAWQGDGIWYYPREEFGYDATGIATIIPDSPPRLAADGEMFDQTALAASHQTLQLPAIARVTNLANGRQILVRIIDRGPDSPARLIGLTQRAAQLLEIGPDGVAPVRVTLDAALSQRLASDLSANSLGLQAAPRGDAVQQEGLPPPPGAAGSAGAQASNAAAPQAASDTKPVPSRLPETIWQAPVQPVLLMLYAGSFGRLDYARQLQARLAGLNPEIRRQRQGHSETDAVYAGPFTNIADADAALDRALAVGVSDARIVVE